MKYPLRFAAFAALMVVPFLRFLVENRFSLLRSESVVAAGLFCLPALLYASFGRRVFVPLLIVCSVIVAGDSFRQQSAAIVSLSLVAAAAILGLCFAQLRIH